jgi:predicted nucleotidyltransferase
LLIALVGNRCRYDGSNTEFAKMVEQRHIDYWRQRQAEQRTEQQCLTQQAWEEVDRIAKLLQQQFGATQVIVFGSLVKDTFHSDSDIDLAVAGISAADYFAAVAAANQISQRWVDLKPLESLEPHFKERVLTTGKVINATD